MDMITWSHKSDEGNKYLVVLRCLATGALKLIPLYRKYEIDEAFEEWVMDMRNDPLYMDHGYPLVCFVQTDNAGEWAINNDKWQNMCDNIRFCSSMMQNMCGNSMFYRLMLQNTCENSGFIDL